MPVSPAGALPVVPGPRSPAPRSYDSPIPIPESQLHPESPIPNPQSRLHLYYGGTFDPIHLGHLAIACAARDELGALVHLVPAADPPHRPAPGATAVQRARMLELALADTPGLVLDTRELRRASHGGAPSYTVDTLRELRAQLGPATPIAWLLGADAFVGLSSWHRWEALFELAHFVVAERPGVPLDLAEAPQLAQAVQGRWAASAGELGTTPAGRLWRLHQPLRGESASAVRSRIATGGDWQALVPPSVAAFIARECLYGSAQPSS
ncbi:nicotinate-nucleotide adenylyltransferase [Xanthomonas gardneri]|uniref:Probable nicotinate-nucleotide adenylyltransferase n=12 Tax=Xanthomonas hortorum TaxID=56454 RepID=A0A6V7CQF2_9XANT|nr:nicotinate-nucleotide adenylyltransferase [Xanthomonas hortorum pv. gardneri]PPU44172.1 nicotinate-nucleotide adenylyltransferase [Xanthomonas hortorum pv. cynarae]CAH2709135.1 Nicotinate-nucleotide adenylyltransferase [Xanthomonas campestris pv. nigromaculans]CAD0319348.1 Nicotinate-nucleotide adenylyltransferase [Xanthomonas hortorum pv. gardneri]CAD0319357.1 Nicotinate-nucleotide adenylyltransferase [Xanthomonas hortorum pv. gardneri]